MSAGNDEPRYPRLLRRMLWFALGVAAATVGMIWATLLTTGQAQAQPLNLPGIGVIDIPNQAGVPERIEQGLHPVPIAPQQHSSSATHTAPDPGAIVRSAVGYGPAPRVAHPAPANVGSTARAVAIPEITHPDATFAQSMLRAAVAPLPRADRYVGTPGHRSVNSPAATPRTQAPARAFTFGPAAPAPRTGQSAAPALPPALDIPPVRQFLSTPQLHGLNIPGLTLPQVQPAPQARPAPHETTGQRALDAARSKLGAGYRYGSAGPDAFDCSGLVQWSYRQAGVNVPRTSYGQLDSGKPVPLNQLQPGDLVSFYGGGHSAIYEGNGRVIHAATEGTGVTESPISQMPVTGARRF